MPWIDPVKEAEAWRIQIRGAATESDGSAQAGATRMRSNVAVRLKLRKTAGWGWSLILTPLTTKEATVPELNNSVQQATDSQHEE